MPPAAKLPSFPLNHLPVAERQAAQHIHRLLENLANYEEQFRAAVMLVDCCEAELGSKASQVAPPGVTGAFSMDSTVETLAHWMSMAARDGALAIYHFGSTIAAIRHNLPSFPTLNAAVDHMIIRMAHAEFRKDFPRFEAIRYVVSHAADFMATLSKKRKHDHQGLLEARTVKATEGIEFSGSLWQRTYIVDFKGNSHSYEITHKNANKLLLAKLRIYSSLGMVSNSRTTS